MTNESAKKSPEREGTKLSAEHFAFLRGWVQGLPERDLWNRYLVRLGEYDRRRAPQFMKAVQTELGAIGRRSGRPEVAAVLRRRPSAAALDIEGEGETRAEAHPPAAPSPALPARTAASRQKSVDVLMPSLEEFAARFDEDMYSESELLELWQEERRELELSLLAQATTPGGTSAVEPAPGPADGPRGEIRLLPPSARSAERRARLITRQLEMLSWLESLACEKPQADDLVSAWLDPKVCERLAQVGIRSLGDLTFFIRDRGHRWFAKVPKIGEKGAKVIVEWLMGQRATLGALPAHALFPRASLDAHARAAATLPPDGSQAQVTHIAPLERLRVPSSLASAGFDLIGSNRAPQQQCKLKATNDFEAIQEWLGLRPSGSHTWRAYRREAERFLLWAVFARKTPLSALTSSDCVAYRDFLANPGSEWCGQRHRVRWSPAWRPFEGPLSTSAAETAVTILSAMCEWLTRRRYLDTNPWDGVPKSVRPPAMPISRAFTRRQWTRMEEWMAELPDDLRSQRLRLIIGFAYRSGMRESELANAKVEWLRREEIDGAVKWSIMVLGKRMKWRQVALPASAIRLLADYFEARALSRELLSNPPQTPLIAALPRGQAQDPGLDAQPVAAEIEVDGQALTPGRIYEIVKDSFARCAATIATSDPDSAQRFMSASTHWLRHTYGTHAAETMPTDVLQVQMGHASPATTAIYNKAEMARRYAAIEDAFKD